MRASPPVQRSGTACRKRCGCNTRRIPYPRWLAITRGDVLSIEQRVRRWSPGYVAPAELGGSLRMLFAGCGTGMDAINGALHLDKVDVTAVDLSRASLAYGMRKAAEYGLENIRFRQEDILEMDTSGEPYHVINCTGVLHHMQDPAAGLEHLVQLLIPGGLIALALYSRLARAPLLEARALIRASGFGSSANDIRLFRQQVLGEGVRGPLAELIGSTDFFSTSECRDLLFHVQETQLTLPGTQQAAGGEGFGVSRLRADHHGSGTGFSPRASRRRAYRSGSLGRVRAAAPGELSLHVPVLVPEDKKGTHLFFLRRRPPTEEK